MQYAASVSGSGCAQLGLCLAVGAVLIVVLLHCGYFTLGLVRHFTKAADGFVPQFDDFHACLKYGIH